MRIRFTKMHGLGNDFVVLDAINQYYTRYRMALEYQSQKQTEVGPDQPLEQEGNP